MIDAKNSNERSEETRDVSFKRWIVKPPAVTGVASELLFEGTTVHNDT
jgi:hypothetical protein